MAQLFAVGWLNMHGRQTRCTWSVGSIHMVDGLATHGRQARWTWAADAVDAAIEPTVRGWQARCSRSVGGRWERQAYA
ncbi:MAG: hypothetical protein IJV22_03165 [Bacteroidales bacterium]|nr:hypothetical protein [Bacteroidales bacterium]